MKKKFRIRKSPSDIGIDILIILFFTAFTLMCIFPFYYLFINTISNNDLVVSGKVNFYPREITFTNYANIFKVSTLLYSIFITFSRTVLGTFLMVITTAWAAYLITKKKMWKRSFWYRFLVITMYFNAGLVPWFINMKMLDLTGSFLAYIIPGMVAPYNIILVKTYIESIPDSLEESAIIDGASTPRVFFKIIIPLALPILATITIFGAVGNWNSFQDSLLLMSSTPKLMTLQHVLYTYLNQNSAAMNAAMNSGGSSQLATVQMNSTANQYTIAMVSIIPILLVYPFMQRFFVKGIMLGAVKG
ncbi:MAG: ABC transporter permease [Clostridiales bacterium]|nr:ABC transporter permease [Clostridiales bacterium]